MPGGAPAGVVDGRKDVLFAAGVAAGVEPAGVPKPKDGVEDGAEPPNAPPAPAPPKRFGFGASPVAFPNDPKADVVDAPDVAWPPPNNPPGLLVAGVLEAPPPKTLDELIAVFPLPKSPLPGVLDAALAVPKSDGVAPLDELVAPNSGLLGVLLLLLLCVPKENDDAMLAVVGGVRWETGQLWGVS